MANRRKDERNNKILELWDDGKGWRQQSIANQFRMTVSAVSMVIYRAKQESKR